MSYAVEWMGGVVSLWMALLLVFVPWFATIAVLVVALAAVVGLLALAAAALASPYLLVRRLARRRTRPIYSPSEIPSRSAAGSSAGLGRPHLTVLADHEPDEAGAIFEDVTRHAA